MAEKFYKVAESSLVAIADAIRFQKKVTPEQRKYTLEEMPRVIKAMLILPSDYAYTEVTEDMNITATAILPRVYKGVANSDIDSKVNPTCVGVLPTVYRGLANSTVGRGITSTAVGVLTEN